MANDKHFRVKNGLKVGDKEIISASGIITASTVNIGTQNLSDFVSGTNLSISSLSASLGTYEDSLNTLTLIEEAQQSASSALSSAQAAATNAGDQRDAASTAKAAALLAQQQAEGFRDNAENAKSSASVAAVSAETFRDNASTFRAATEQSKASAEEAKSDAEAAKTLAESYAGNSESSHNTALGFAQCALKSASAAMSSYLVSDASASAANSSRSAAEIYAGEAASSATTANTARASAIIAEGISVNAQTNSETAANNAKTAEESAVSAASVAQVSAASADLDRIAAANAATSANSAKVSAVNAELISVSASTVSQNAASDSNAAKLDSESAASVAAVSAASADLHRIAAASAATTANAAQVSAVLAEGFSVNAQTASQTAANNAKTAQAASESAASAAQVSSATADGFRSLAGSAATTANNAKAAAVLAEGISVSAKTVAQDAASDSNASKLLSESAASAAQVSSAAADLHRAAAGSASTTANSAAAAALLSEQLSVSAKTVSQDAASDSNASKLLSESSASVAAVSAASADAFRLAAGSAATSANTARASALLSEGIAVSAETVSQNAADNAQDAQSDAEAAQQASESAASVAAVAKAAADISKDAAVSAATTANTAKASAILAEGISINAQTASEVAANNAKTAQESSESAASAAQVSSANADLFRIAAASAATSASAAQVSATTSEGIAVNASTVAQQSAQTSIDVSLNPFFEFGKNGWHRVSGGSDTTFESVSSVSSAITAGKALKIPNGGTASNFQLATNRKVPIDTTRSYRIRGRLKAVSDSSDDFTRIYVGIICYDANGNLLTPNYGGTYHYVATNGQHTLYADGNFHTFSKVVTGESTTSFDTFHTGTKFIKLLTIVNHDAASDADYVLVDELSIEDVTASEQAASSAASAFVSETNAASSATTANSAAGSAFTFKEISVSASTVAQDSASDANASQIAADASEAAAAISAGDSANSATTASSAKASAVSAKDIAVSARTVAQAAETDAERAANVSATRNLVRYWNPLKTASLSGTDTAGWKSGLISQTTDQENTNTGAYGVKVFDVSREGPAYNFYEGQRVRVTLWYKTSSHPTAEWVVAIREPGSGNLGPAITSEFDLNSDWKYLDETYTFTQDRTGFGPAFDNTNNVSGAYVLVTDLSIVDVTESEKSKDSASDALASEASAGVFASDAANSATTANSARASAVSAKDIAVSARTVAVNSASDALASEVAAGISETNAASSATSANSAQGSAIDAKTIAVAARTAASSARVATVELNGNSQFEFGLENYRDGRVANGELHTAALSNTISVVTGGPTADAAAKFTAIGKWMTTNRAIPIDTSRKYEVSARIKVDGDAGESARIYFGVQCADINGSNLIQTPGTHRWGVAYNLEVGNSTEYSILSGIFTGESEVSETTNSVENRSKFKFGTKFARPVILPYHTDSTNNFTLVDEISIVDVTERELAKESADEAESARAAAVISETNAAESATTANSARASAVEAKDIAVSAQTVAENSASNANASKVSAGVSEINAASSATSANSAQGSAISAKNLSVSAQTVATTQSVENQNLIATGGFIGKNIFEDNDEGRWSANNTPLIASEGLPAHPLGRTRAYKSDSRDAYYSALNTNQSGFYEQSAHNRTFKVTGYCYSANVAGSGRPPVDARAGLRSYNGTNAVGNSQWPTIIAASAATTGWVYYSGTFTVDDSDGAYLAPFLQNSGWDSEGDTLISYWTDMTLEDVTATESARKAASAAATSEANASLSEVSAGNAATSANSARASAVEAKEIAVSAKTVAENSASDALASEAAASISETNAASSATSANSAQGSAIDAKTLAVQARTGAEAAETSVKVLSANPFFEFDEIGWERHGGSLPSTFTSGTSGAVTAGKYLIAPQGNAGTNNDGYHWYNTEKKIPFDKDRYYKFTARFKAVSSNSGHFSRVYAGAVPFNAAGNPITGHVGGTHHYVTTKGQVTINADGNWHTYTNIVHGVDPDNFASNYNVMPLDTKFISPQFLVGWSNSNAEFTYIDEISVEDVTGEELAKISASAANSSRAAAEISETNAASSATTANSAVGSAISAKDIAVSARTVAQAAETATVELGLNPYFEFGMTGWRRTESEGNNLDASIVVIDDSNATGGKALKSSVTSSAGWITTERKIPIDLSKIYEVRFRTRAVGSGSDFTKMYAGVCSYDADGNIITIGSPGTHRYGVLSDVTITQSSEYVTYTGLFTGAGNNDTNKFKVGTKFASPMMIPFRSGATADYTLVDELSIADVTEREQAKESASDALASKASAAISASDAADAATTASSAASSASNSLTLAVASQTAAADSASDANASKATALVHRNAAASSATTANQAAGSASNSLTLANSAKTASENAADSALVHAQSASSSVNELTGELQSSVKDVTRLSATVTSGLNGHYVSNAWYLDNAGTANLPATVVAIEPGSEIRVEEIPSSTGNLVTNGNFTEDTTGWSYTFTAAGNSAPTVSNGRIITDGGNVSQQITGLTQGAKYRVDFRVHDYSTDGSGPILVIADHNLSNLVNFAFATPTFSPTTDRTASPQFIKVDTTQLDYYAEFEAPGTSISIALSGGVSGLGNQEVSDISLREIAETHTLTSNATPNQVYKLPDSGVTGLGHYKVTSNAPIVVKHPQGYSAVPQNFSSDKLAMYHERYFPVKATLFSPYADATVEVYAEVNTTADLIVHEGITPPLLTFTIPKGSYYSWSSGQVAAANSHLSEPTSDTQDLAVIFKANTRILGVSHRLSVSASGDYKLLAPMTNRELVGSSLTTEKSYPRLVSGGGININNLKLLLLAQNAGQLGSSNAPIIQARINDNNGGYNYGNVDQQGGSISSTDANAVGSWGAGLTTNATTYRRVEQLIRHLDSHYASLETTFTYNSNSYTLYDNPPESDYGFTETNNIHIEPNSSRTYLHVSGTNDGDGGDSEICLPREALSDYYVYNSPTLMHFMVASVEPNQISVYDRTGRNIFAQSATYDEIIDHTLASITNPLQNGFGSYTDQNVDLGAGAGPFTFVGTAPFFLTAQDTTTEDETTMLGAKQGILSGEISQRAAASEISVLSSTVDDNTTTLTTTKETVDGHGANFTVKADNNGYISGFGLLSSTSGTATSSFFIAADTFSIVNPDTFTGGFGNLNPSDSSVPFKVDQGVALIKNAFIANLTASSIKVSALSGDRISSTGVLEVFTPSDKENTYAALDGNDPVYRIYAGSSKPKSAPFAVTTKGDVFANSLTFRGPVGQFYDSSAGFGLGALSELKDYLQSGRIETRSKILTEDFDTSDSSTYTVLTLSASSNLYQQYRIDATDLSITKNYERYYTPQAPIKILVGSSTNLNGSKTHKPTLNSSNDVVWETDLGRKLYRGEYVALDFVTDTQTYGLNSGSKLSTSEFCLPNDSGESPLTNVPVGPGTDYESGILLKVRDNANMAYPNFAITRPGLVTISYIHGYSGYGISEIGTLKNLLETDFPRKIRVTPKRADSPDITNIQSIMQHDGSDSDHLYHQNGYIEFHGVLNNASFTDELRQFRILIGEELISWNKISCTASVEVGRADSAGAVDREGFLTAWTTDAQATNDVVGNALPAGDYAFGMELEFRTNASGAYSGSLSENTVSRVVETEILKPFDEFFFPHHERLELQADQKTWDSAGTSTIDYTAVRSSIASAPAVPGSNGYGIFSSGDSYWSVVHDASDYDPINGGDRGQQAMFLGSANESSGSWGTNLFVIARKDSDTTNFDQKLRLNGKGELYIGNTAASSEKVATVEGGVEVWKGDITEADSASSLTGKIVYNSAQGTTELHLPSSEADSFPLRYYYNGGLIAGLAGNGFFTNMAGIQAGGAIAGLYFTGTGGTSTFKDVTVNEGLSASSITVSDGKGIIKYLEITVVSNSDSFQSFAYTLPSGGIALSMQILNTDFRRTSEFLTNDAFGWDRYDSEQGSQNINVRIIYTTDLS